MKKKVFVFLTFGFLIALGFVAKAKVAQDCTVCCKSGQGCIVKFSDGSSTYYPGKWN